MTAHITRPRGRASYSLLQRQYNRKDPQMSIEFCGGRCALSLASGGKGMYNIG